MDKADKLDLNQSTRHPFKSKDLAFSREVNRQGQRNWAIRYPEFILVDIIMVSEARYKTLHSTSHRNLPERVGEVDTALSYEPGGRGFETRFVFFFLPTFFVLFSGYCSIVQGNLET